MIILFDMDEVLADFEGWFIEEWKKRFPDTPHVQLKDRLVYGIQKQYSESLLDKIDEIRLAKGFTKNIPPLKGAIEAFLELSKDHTLFICTSPPDGYRNVIEEKFVWIEEHLGKEWIKKVIVTRDKTLVQGDVLIDDNPQIKGSAKPTWKQVYVEFPYNTTIKEPKIKRDWSNWREVLMPVLNSIK